VMAQPMPGFYRSMLLDRSNIAAVLVLSLSASLLTYS
jgi:hypothetical protein